MAVDVQIFISRVLIFGGWIWDSPLLKLMLKRNLRCVHNRIPTTNPPMRLIRRWSFWWISQDSDWYKHSNENADGMNLQTQTGLRQRHIHIPSPSLSQQTLWSLDQEVWTTWIRWSFTWHPQWWSKKKGSLGNACHRIALQVLAGEMKIIFKSAGRQLIYGSLQDSN